MVLSFIEIMEAELIRLEEERALVVARAEAVRTYLRLNNRTESFSFQKCARLTDTVIINAKRLIARANGRPVRSQTILDALTAGGVSFSAKVPRNIISSYLSRSPEFVAHGRSGWTLSASDQDIGEKFPVAVPATI